MLIHSVTPTLLLQEMPDLPAYTVREASFGLITGAETADGFQICRIHSTNPSDYLNKSYSPGSIYKG